ncbi:hypothetical protein [Frigidibacter sp. MR17.24]|uniref:hypothetical protein n=1 Tax=Frigidibacter sp. MR17.24 TaxID=3127345 RepID=UPI00301303D8
MPHRQPAAARTTCRDAPRRATALTAALPAALLACAAGLAGPAAASSDDAWQAFRQQVADSCAALVTDPGEVTTEVAPFGSESYGAAIVTLASAAGTDRMICILDKATGTAELTGPLPPG